MDLFDLHCDTASRMQAEQGSLADGDYQVTLTKARAFERWAQVFAIFVRDGSSGEAAHRVYRAQVDYFAAQLALNSGAICQCRTAQQLNEALRSGKRAAILSVENGSALGGRIETLREFAADGVRALTLTWFGENDLGFGSIAGGRLKPFGREVLKALPQYGIVPDISHLSDEGMADVFSQYDGPVIATHSNARAVTGHCRNLTNAQIGEIVRRGGIIGLNLYGPFLTSDAPGACCEDAYRHIDAFLSLGAQGALCLGTDFDGGGGIEGAANISQLADLYEFLLQKNLPQAVVDAIFYGNAHHFWSGASES